MRLSVFLLLLANVANLAFSQLLAGNDQRLSQQLAQRELHPEKLRIIRVSAVRHEEMAQAEAKYEPPTRALVEDRRKQAVCLKWDGIALQDVSRSQMVLNSAGATYRVVGVKPPEHHWVYIPAIKTAAAVDDLVAQLSAAGERGFAVSRPTGQGMYQISLGVFRSEEGARRQHERFVRLGAVLAPHGTARTTYIVQGAAEIIEKIAAAAWEFQETTVEAADCPGTRTS